MPRQLPDDRPDPGLAERYLTGVIDPGDPFYRPALSAIRRAHTGESLKSTAYRVRAILGYFRRNGIAPLAVTRDDVEDWLATLTYLQPTTIESYLTTLRTVYEEAIDRGLLARNPARRLSVGRHEEAKPPALTREEAQRILDAIRAELDDADRRLVAARDYLVFALGFTLGPRCAELRRITFEDLDPDGDPPTVVLFRKGRKYDEQRLSPLAVEAVRLLRHVLETELGIEIRPSDAPIMRLDAQCPLQLTHSRPEDDILPMSDAALYNLVRNRLLDAGLSGRKLGTHRLRATAATLAWLATRDVLAVQTLMAHARVDTTVRRYINPAENLLHSATDAVPLAPAGLIKP